MLDKATNPKAKRSKVPPAVGGMPDSSTLGRQTHLGQAALEARQAPDGSPCFCHPDGHPAATHASLEPPQQTEDKGKDLAQIDSDSEASSSSSVSRKVKKRKAATPVPADGNAAPIMVEASQASEQPADPILHSSTSVKKFKGGEDDVKDYLQNRAPKILQDRPGHTDLTPSMLAYLAKHPELTGEEQVEGEGEGEAADHLQVNEPPMGIGGETVRVASFQAGFANEGGDRVLKPSLEMKQGYLH